MKTTKRPTSQAATEKIREAEAVRDELKAALHGCGIVLPSLNVEATAYGDENPRPLLDLGRCNVETARKLAAALRPNPCLVPADV